MGATISSNGPALGAQRSMAASASSFVSWLQNLSSGVNTAGDLNKVLNDILHEAPPALTAPLWSQIDTMASRREVLAAERRIRELETQLARMRELAYEDQLTGSLNRRGLADLLDRELARAERRHSPLCVALIDLDDFKLLNDTYGHCAGDAALVHVVKTIKDTLRKTDAIARFGGEEFALVLPDTPLEDAHQTMIRVQADLAERAFVHADHRLSIRFSAGITLCHPGERQAALFARADQALYAAKKTGKNRVVVAK